MREQAHVIQKEVRLLLDDVVRLEQRTSNLKSHFGNAEKDVLEIEISTKKITSRAATIEKVEVGDPPVWDGP
ncbi:MAG: hypothetical protein JSS00_00560 [Proteobacteria bacterium]|nr:hypothetical protein [Pseudomonadota bacterium]